MRRFLPFFLLLLPFLAPNSPALAAEGLLFSIAPVRPVAGGAAVLKAAYARLGIPVTFKSYPARRGLTEANQGVTDGEAVRMGGLSAELPNLIQIEPPIATVQGVAVTCDPSLHVESRADLIHLRVGVHPGIRLSDKLTDGLEHVTKGQWDQLFRMLHRNRLDVVIGYDGIERTQAGQPGAARLRVIRPKSWYAPLYHYLNRKHADEVPRIEAELRRMRDSGEMRRILDAARNEHLGPTGK